jgi:alpha-1,3-rhamnosyl/mannosyltransferase
MDRAAGSLLSAPGASVNALRVGLGTAKIEPGLTGGRLDGIGVYTAALLRYLPGAGCAVTGYSYPRLRGRHGEISVGRPMPHSFEAAVLRDLVTPGAQRMHMPADIFHATDYRIVRMDCPLVASLHDALPISHPEWCSARLRGIKNWLQRNAARKGLYRASHFASTNWWPAGSTRSVACAVGWTTNGWPRYPGAVAATLRAHGLRAGYFLSVGTLQPRKNIGRLLDAYLGLPAALRAERALVIVGAPGWRCEELVRRIAAARENGAQVVWLNALTDAAALRHVYAGAGVFVFPSLYEGFGIPVVEAFGAGVPVVASNSSSLPEVCQGAALEVDPASAGEIGAAMLALVREDGLRARCIERGRRRAEVLSWRETARQTAAVYRSVLAR